MSGWIQAAMQQNTIAVTSLRLFLFCETLADKNLKGLTIVEGQIPKRKRFLTFETADSVVTVAWRGWRRVGFMQEIPNFSFNTRYCY